MPNSKSRFVAFALFLELLCLCAGKSTVVSAQTKPETTKAGSTRLAEQVTRGEGLFRQRCSVCHLARKLKFGSPATVGPNLAGVFKGASAADQKLLRAFILKGSQNMPGFQYGLDASEMDDLMIFLQTL